MGMNSTSTASEVRQRIESGGERFWRPGDFEELPPAAVAKTLSQLTSEGEIERTHKGVYYHPRETEFGPSVCTAGMVASEVLTEPVFASGTLSANVLGFSTQIAMRPTYATTAHHPPAVLKDATVFVRRPYTWRKLEPDEGAVLEFLRDRGRNSELSREETSEKMVGLFKENPEKLEKLIRLSEDEPARVRAMLGAIGEELGVNPKLLHSLRGKLSAYSKYDFGRLSALKYAKKWQAN